MIISRPTDGNWNSVAAAAAVAVDRRAQLWRRSTPRLECVCAMTFASTQKRCCLFLARRHTAGASLSGAFRSLARSRASNARYNSRRRRRSMVSVAAAAFVFAPLAQSQAIPTFAADFHLLQLAKNNTRTHKDPTHARTHARSHKQTPLANKCANGKHGTQARAHLLQPTTTTT